MADLAQGALGTWFIIHNSLTGVQVSEGDTALPTAGLTAVQLTHRPDPLVERWDPVTRALVPTTQATQTFQAPPGLSVYTFVSYELTDTGLILSFFGPMSNGKRGNTTIFFTDAEMNALSNQNQVTAAVQTKLGRKVRATGFVTKLDPLIGSVVTV